MIENRRFVSQPMPWTSLLAFTLVCAAPPTVILSVCLVTLYFNLF